MLALDQAAVRAPQGHWLLQEVTLELKPQALYAVVGPNGAGKSTLLGVLAGLRRLTRGRSELDGVALQRWSASALARRRAVMLQDTAVALELTVRELVELGRYPHRQRPSAHEEALIDCALAEADLTALGQRSVGSLSGGERARAHWARAWAQIGCPGAGLDDEAAGRWLLLDEPTAALDWTHQHRLLQRLRSAAEQSALGVVVVLHDLNLALRYAHQVVLVHQGRVLACGTPAQVLSPRRVQQVWGVAAQHVTARDGAVQLIT